jgi:hypothetical protein
VWWWWSAVSRKTSKIKIKMEASPAVKSFEVCCVVLCGGQQTSKIKIENQGQSTHQLGSSRRKRVCWWWSAVSSHQTANRQTSKIEIKNQES